MTLDIQALSFENLNWFKPCECGSHSFYLDDKMRWQCSHCKPHQRLDTIRFELYEEDSVAADQAAADETKATQCTLHDTAISARRRVLSPWLCF